MYIHVYIHRCIYHSCNIMYCFVNCIHIFADEPFWKKLNVSGLVGVVVGVSIVVGIYTLCAAIIACTREGIRGTMRDNLRWNRDMRWKGKVLHSSLIVVVKFYRILFTFGLPRNYVVYSVHSGLSSGLEESDTLSCKHN